MPLKGEAKLRASKAWRDRVMPQGYGKWLYARRKLRFDDAERFRSVLESILDTAEHGRMRSEERLEHIAFHAREALEESDRAEAELGPWEPPDESQI